MRLKGEWIVDMYIVNQDRDRMIELHSIRYSYRWSNLHEKVIENINPYDLAYYTSDPYTSVIRQMETWERDHPYEEIVDIYVNEDQKFGTFYSRQRGIKEYENILKALEDGVVVYRIPEINDSERENGK